MPLAIDRTTYRSPNHSDRPIGAAIDMIILHSGEGTKQSDIRELTRDDVPIADRVSAHYYVDRIGRIYELVDPKYEAWHAGISTWQGRTSLEIRQHSIGIETEHKQGQTWPAVQRQALADLCRSLIDRYRIRQDMIAAHRWIAPRRKFDPTDWPDAELRPWIARLYAATPDPLRAAQLLGTNGATFFCSAAAAGFYLTHGGVGLFGLLTASEAHQTDALGQPCTVLPCERVVIKTVPPAAPHLALIQEFIVEEWA